MNSRSVRMAAGAAGSVFLAVAVVSADEQNYVIWMQDVQGPASIPDGATYRYASSYYGFPLKDTLFTFMVKDDDPAPNKDDSLDIVYSESAPVSPDAVLHQGTIQFQLYCRDGKVMSKGPINGKSPTKTGERTAEIFVQHMHHWSWGSWHGHKTRKKKVRCE